MILCLPVLFLVLLSAFLITGYPSQQAAACLWSVPGNCTVGMQHGNKA
jgi:hypothetical protein